MVMMALQIYNIILASAMQDHQSRWLYRLRSVEDYYTCTDKSLWIDLDFFRKEFESNSKVIFLFVIAGNLSLVVMTLS